MKDANLKPAYNAFSKYNFENDLVKYATSTALENIVKHGMPLKKALKISTACIGVPQKSVEKAVKDILPDNFFSNRKALPSRESSPRHRT